uniref:HIG1 domain-containing protein n=1 Tax=Strongyloides stercoralis TaxID=6248 RepID=A0A0K0EJB3_STRER
MINLRTIKCNKTFGSYYKPLCQRFLSTTISKRSEVEKKTSETVYEKPNYATMDSYNEIRKKTENQGVKEGLKSKKPTPFQKRMLVWTGIYKNKEEIPEYISPGTMNKLSDRYRISFIIVFSAIIFAIFFVSEKYTVAKIERKKKLGYDAKSE